MRPDLNDVVAWMTDRVLRLCRMPPLNGPRVYGLLTLAPMQRILERVGRRRAIAVFRRAKKRCPAYAQFIEVQCFSGRVTREKFAEIPETTKQNYVKVYSIEERCNDGAIPRAGVVIDESSGSSGAPNNWVRGNSERAGVRRLLEHALAMRFRDRPVFLINCFALGPWATGLNVSMSLAERCIVKSVGPDASKLEATLTTFGTDYEYAISGYPPFIKDFLDGTSLDLSPYTLHLLVGGEGIAEPLRDRFLGSFKSVFSSYGASDLEINMAAETPLSIAVRRLCVADPALSEELFGRIEPPMLFQYNPLDYLVETNAEEELVFTLLRPGYAAPKVRYNIRDLGGTFTHRDLVRVLARHGVDIASLPSGPAFPFLYVAGRSDLTVGFYGAKILVTDLDATLSADPLLCRRIFSFQMRVVHDEDLTERLHIDLERVKGDVDQFDLESACQAIIEGLRRVNQDFREVSKMFSEDSIRIELHDHGSGPFADRDIRVKHSYVAGSS